MSGAERIIEPSSYEIFGRVRLEPVVPMRYGDRLVPESDPVTDREESASLQRLAIFAAYEAALAVASEVKIETVLQRLVDLARSVVHGQMAVLQVTGQSAADPLIARSCGGPYAEACATLTDPLNQWLTAEDPPPGPERVTDLRRDDRFAALAEQGMASLAIVPLRHDHDVIGTLLVAADTQTRTLNADDLRALMLLAEHATAAIARARQFGAVERRGATAREQLIQLRAVLENLPAGVMLLHPPDAWIQMANSAAVSLILGDGAPRSSIPVVFRDFTWESMDGMELPRRLHPGMRALRGERIENRQLILRTSTGRHVPVLVQSAPIMTDGGDVIGAVVVFQDVSRLRAAEQIKDDFLSLISHEFRTPLTAIHGGALFLQQQGDELDRETFVELLDDIGTESARLDRMLGNLLSVAEIMAGRLQATTEPVWVDPLVRELIEEFDRRSPNHRFTYLTEPNLPLAEGDPEWLAQIMRNLYENAVKYSPEGGEIRTSCERKGEWVSISVEDNGLGILAEHVPHVFERFRRPGADPTVRGMGLGLYLSRLLVDAQGGRTHAHSDGPGAGSTFIVELPVVKEWDRNADVRGT